ncbi:hypothetical protein PWT90_08154 [Aphanocladium album]|nr:hypothetical protein PWT90_08154 [Aphanocladium album]
MAGLMGADLSSTDKPPKDKLPRDEFKNMPSEVFLELLALLDARSLLAMSLTHKRAYFETRELLCQTVRLDISPTDSAFQKIRMARQHFDNGHYEKVRALTLMARKTEEADRAVPAVQMSILKIAFDFSRDCNELRHLGLESHNLSPLQIQGLYTLSRAESWMKPSLSLYGPANTIFAHHYNFERVRSFATDQDIRHEVIRRVAVETGHALERLALLATYESIRVLFPTVALPKNYRIPISPTFNKTIPVKLALCFPKLEWLIIRPAPLPKDSHLVHYDKHVSDVFRAEFLENLKLLSKLKRLVLNFRSPHVYREAHFKGAQREDMEITEQMWKWCAKLARDIFDQIPSLEEVCVRLSWPHYFTVYKDKKGEFFEATGQFTYADRYAFPIGLCY